MEQADFLAQEEWTSEAFRTAIDLEDDRVELKTGAGKALQEALVAFSNTEGGHVLIGVTDDREVVGRELNQGTSDRIERAAADARDLGAYRIGQIMVGGRPVVVVEVRAVHGRFAQTSDGRVLVRRRGRKRALMGAELLSFVQERTASRFETAPSGRSITHALDGSVAELHDAYGVEHGADLLRQLGLALGDELTHAGELLLTAVGGGSRFQTARVDVRRVDGTTEEFVLREIVTGTVQEQIRRTVEVLMRELGHELVIVGAERVELPRLPEPVIRETIANAVAHRDYSGDRTSVVVEARADRVVVRSPGGFVPPVNAENIRRVQSARNPTVLEVLRQLRLAEGSGKGVDRIEDEMRSAMLDAPGFREVDGSVEVVLPLRGVVSARERAWVMQLELGGTLEPEDRMLLVLLARGEELANSRVREALHVDEGSARAALKRLVDAGFATQRGRRGGTRYRLAEGVASRTAFGRLGGPLVERIVIEAAHEQPLSNADVRELTGLDRQGALRLLSDLVERKRLRRSGEKRGTRYHATSSEFH